MLERKNSNLILLNFFISILLFYFLLNSNILHKYFVGGSLYIFGDYKAALNMVVCSQENQSLSCPEFAYGKILTFLPYSDDLKFTYDVLIPYLLILIFVFFITYSFEFKRKINIIIFYLSLFNPSTLLLIERLNLDILIFISIFIFALNKIFLINWIILINLVLLKIYPIILTLIIFYENQKRNIYNSLIIFSIIFVIIIFLILKFNLLETLNAYGTESKAGYFYLFSFNHLPKFLKYSFGLNYIVSLTLLGLIFIYSVFRLCRLNNIEFLNFNNNYRELILFNLGASILILSYLIYSNYYYREIFLICTFPLLLKEEVFKFKYIKYFLYFSISRYSFEYIYSFVSLSDFIYYVNGMRYFKGSYLLVSYIKSFFDLVLIVWLSSLVFIVNRKIVIEKLFPFNKLLRN